jgi:hypothetical protein
MMLCGMLLSGLSACVQAPAVNLIASDCRKLVPESWKQGVKSAPLPHNKTVGELAAFGDAQTGQLDIANNRFMEADEIQERCEALLKKAGEDAQPKSWWKVWE